MPPLFSIGITTYNRKSMLQECVASVLNQSYDDVEVIVGNDFVSEPISAQSLGFNDPRLTIVNYPKNLGEVGNLAALLEMATGKYFTWLADDDGLLPGFLKSVHTALESYPTVGCVFTSYVAGHQFPQGAETAPAPKAVLLDGRTYLGKFLGREISLLALCGAFETTRLRELGGLEQLGTGFSPYSDNHLAIKAATLERIAYMDAPLVFFRTHDGSASWASPDTGAYFTAQQDLCKRSIEIFQTEPLTMDLQPNLDLLLRWCAMDYFAVMRRTGRVKVGELLRYLRFIGGYMPPLGRYRYALAAMVLSGATRQSVRLTGSRVKQALLRRFRSRSSAVVKRTA